MQRRQPLREASRGLLENGVGQCHSYPLFWHSLQHHREDLPRFVLMCNAPAKMASVCCQHGSRAQSVAGYQPLSSHAADQGLTGTKLGCGEGGCGACTVMVSKKAPGSETVTHMAVNACLCPLYTVAGCHVITVEGIGNVRDGLHPVQVRL